MFRSAATHTALFPHSATLSHGWLDVFRGFAEDSSLGERAGKIKRSWISQMRLLVFFFLPPPPSFQCCPHSFWTKSCKMFSWVRERDI